jgi:dehydrogenase/reductase SDR family protein 12
MMSQIITLDETIVVDRPLQEVFAYVSEFSRIEEWDPGVARGTRLTDGTPGVGSEFRIDMKAGFSLHYTIVEFEPEQRMLMTVDSKVFTAREEIRFKTSGKGTSVRYIANFKFPRPLVAANRLFPAAMDRVGKTTMLGLKAALKDDFDAPEVSQALAVADKLVFPGLWRFTRLGFKSARKHWNPVSAFLGGKRAIVTGATSGVGEAAAMALAELGASVTLVARDKRKAEITARAIRKKSGNSRVDVEIADLSLQSQVHELADRLLAADAPVDILVNNAGALFNPRQQTAEGFEKSFALLLLSPYILTERLQPLLARSGNGRVINVLSGGMYTQKIHPDDLQSQRGKYSGAIAYARAKRGLMIVTEEWAQSWAQEGIAVNAMHPGWADTPGVEDSLKTFYRVTRRLLRSPEEGADTAVWLAAATEAGKVSGKFWLDREQHPSHISRHTRESADERSQLLATLQELLESTRPAVAPRRGRRKNVAGAKK